MGKIYLITNIKGEINMRLFHKDLIGVLPRMQLLGQWRECCLIAKQLAEQGTPNHILVNKIINYQDQHFYFYACLILNEMKKRGYKCDFNKFTKWLNTPQLFNATYDDLFAGWHNDRYFMQCYFNLQEKYDCGGISEEEWQKIESLYSDKIK